MKVRFLLGTLVIVATGTVFGYRQASVAAPQPATADKAAMLASTLQIAMFAYAVEAGDTEPGSRGLGTLVIHADELLIVTHGHWAHLTPQLHEVELRDASGDLLLTLDAPAFRTLVVYRDGGTMLLRAPDGLHGLVPARLGTTADLAETVWVMRRALASDRGTIEVGAAAVTAVNDDTFPATIRLHSFDGSGVLPGDSGGGVWANGRLVGNLWAGGVKIQSGVWSRLLGNGQEHATRQLVAALQPLREPLEILPVSNTEQQSSPIGYEHGLAGN
jgi:hypothetical protein